MFTYEQNNISCAETSYFPTSEENRNHSHAQYFILTHNTSLKQIKQLLDVRLLCMDMIGESSCKQKTDTTFAGWSGRSFGHVFFNLSNDTHVLYGAGSKFHILAT